MFKLMMRLRELKPLNVYERSRNDFRPDLVDYCSWKRPATTLQNDEFRIVLQELPLLEFSNDRFSSDHANSGQQLAFHNFVWAQCCIL